MCIYIHMEMCMCIYTVTKLTSFALIAAILIRGLAHGQSHSRAGCSYYHPEKLPLPQPLTHFSN